VIGETPVRGVAAGGPQSGLFVKICGITNMEDAQAAVERGANGLGFVFWPDSPRWVDPRRARQIVASMPSTVMAVGVFVNQAADYINTVAADVGLASVQLHGDESPMFATGIHHPLIKSVHVGWAASAIDDWPVDVTLLADAYDPVKRGGTGGTIDWHAAAKLAQARRLLLAGGLRPDNVAEAILRVKPYGIDVSSGVERAPGLKDHGKLAALFDAVRMAGAGAPAAMPRREPRHRR
jgi:phosphoribosylanthranilate isomerase